MFLKVSDFFFFSRYKIEKVICWCVRVFNDLPASGGCCDAGMGMEFGGWSRQGWEPGLLGSLLVLGGETQGSWLPAPAALTTGAEERAQENLLQPLAPVKAGRDALGQKSPPLLCPLRRGMGPPRRADLPGRHMAGAGGAEPLAAGQWQGVCTPKAWGWGAVEETGTLGGREVREGGEPTSGHQTGQWIWAF
ncbi:unnamed protein product [Lepidochelys olivacea]